MNGPRGRGWWSIEAGMVLRDGVGGPFAIFEARHFSKRKLYIRG